jgi:penicillin amidase
MSVARVERRRPVPEPHAPARQGHRLRNALLAGALALVLASSGTAGLYWRWSRAALPKLDGHARLTGLEAPATIRRDARGVPHIQAASTLDAVRAQGFATAQDRLWQMDLLRRRAQGELAEAFGEGALRADREARTLGLGHAARAALEALDPDSQALLEAYAAGVSAYIASHRSEPPLEFRLLRYEPRPWEAADSIAVGKLLALDLAQGWEAEAFRAAVGDTLPAEVQDLLFPTVFPDDRILFGDDSTPMGKGPSGARSGIDSRGARGGSQGGATQHPPAYDDHGHGSNNWVVSGAHTATGKPLLANDPHLGLGVPSIWTAVHLTAPDLDVAGVTLPGAPGVILGRNRHVAWGCTNVHDDSADLYVEEFDGHDRYKVPGGWETVTVREEPIRVRDGPLSTTHHTVTHRVRVTRHGPLVEIRGRLYALRWTSLDETPELTAFLLMDRASNWEEFQEALRRFPGPSQNFVYADVDGRIAWYSAGRLPIRRSGDGSRPYPGASADGDWTGYVPFESLPHLVDPPSGRIVTANNRLVGADYPFVVTRGGIGPWRAAAIFRALEAREGWTADDMVRLQGERLSLPHLDLARALVDAAGRHRGDRLWDEVAREMSGWDGRMQPDSRAAALAMATFRSLGDRVIGPRVGKVAAAEGLRRRSVAVHRLIRERPPAFIPAGDAGWDEILGGAWQDAIAELTQSLGPDRARWRWGAMNRMAVHHPLSRVVARLSLLLDPPVTEMGGASTTPNVLNITPTGTIEGPSMRFVADLSDPDGIRLVNFMGQSGHPASPHYADQFQAWVNVETPRLPFTPAAVARETRHTLTLVP